MKLKNHEKEFNFSEIFGKKINENNLLEGGGEKTIKRCFSYEWQVTDNSLFKFLNDTKSNIYEGSFIKFEKGYTKARLMLAKEDLYFVSSTDNTLGYVGGESKATILNLSKFVNFSDYYQYGAKHFFMNFDYFRLKARINQNSYYLCSNKKDGLILIHENNLLQGFIYSSIFSFADIKNLNESELIFPKSKMMDYIKIKQSRSCDLNKISNCFLDFNKEVLNYQIEENQFDWQSRNNIKSNNYVWLMESDKSIFLDYQVEKLTEDSKFNIALSNNNGIDLYCLSSKFIEEVDEFKIKNVLEDKQSNFLNKDLKCFLQGSDFNEGENKVFYGNMDFNKYQGLKKKIDRQKSKTGREIALTDIIDPEGFACITENNYRSLMNTFIKFKKKTKGNHLGNIFNIGKKLHSREKILENVKEPDLEKIDFDEIISKKKIKCEIKSITDPNSLEFSIVGLNNHQLHIYHLIERFYYNIKLYIVENNDELKQKSLINKLKAIKILILKHPIKEEAQSLVLEKLGDSLIDILTKKNEKDNCEVFKEIIGLFHILYLNYDLAKIWLAEKFSLIKSCLTANNPILTKFLLDILLKANENAFKNYSIIQIQRVFKIIIAKFRKLRVLKKFNEFELINLRIFIKIISLIYRESPYGSISHNFLIQKFDTFKDQMLFPCLIDDENAIISLKIEGIDNNEGIFNDLFLDYFGMMEHLLRNDYIYYIFQKSNLITNQLLPLNISFKILKKNTPIKEDLEILNYFKRQIIDMIYTIYYEKLILIEPSFYITSHEIFYIKNTRYFKERSDLAKVIRSLFTKKSSAENFILISKDTENLEFFIENFPFFKKILKKNMIFEGYENKEFYKKLCEELSELFKKVTDKKRGNDIGIFLLKILSEYLNNLLILEAKEIYMNYEIKNEKLILDNRISSFFSKLELKKEKLTNILKVGSGNELINFLNIDFSQKSVIKKINQIILTEHEITNIFDINNHLEEIIENKNKILDENLDCIFKLNDLLLEILEDLTDKRYRNELNKLKFDFKTEVINLTIKNKNLDNNDILNYTPQNQEKLTIFQKLLDNFESYKKFYNLYIEFNCLNSNFNIKYKKILPTSEQSTCLYQIRIIITKILVLYMHQNRRNSIKMKELIESNEILIKGNVFTEEQNHYQFLLQYTLHAKVFESIGNFLSSEKISLFQFLDSQVAQLLNIDLNCDFLNSESREKYYCRNCHHISLFIIKTSLWVFNYQIFIPENELIESKLFTKIPYFIKKYFFNAALNAFKDKFSPIENTFGSFQSLDLNCLFQKRFCDWEEIVCNYKIFYEIIAELVEVENEKIFNILFNDFYNEGGESSTNFKKEGTMIYYMPLHIPIAVNLFRIIVEIAKKRNYIQIPWFFRYNLTHFYKRAIRELNFMSQEKITILETLELEYSTKFKTFVNADNNPYLKTLKEFCENYKEDKSICIKYFKLLIESIPVIFNKENHLKVIGDYNASSICELSIPFVEIFTKKLGLNKSKKTNKKIFEAIITLKEFDNQNVSELLNELEEMESEDDDISINKNYREKNVKDMIIKSFNEFNTKKKKKEGKVFI